jgi:hypothetical protein
MEDSFSHSFNENAGEHFSLIAEYLNYCEKKTQQRMHSLPFFVMNIFYWGKQ